MSKYKVDVVIAVITDFSEKSTLCSLCLTTIEDSIVYSIATSNPTKYSMIFHAECYEQIFEGMEQLALKFMNPDLKEEDFYQS